MQADERGNLKKKIGIVIAAGLVGATGWWWLRGDPAANSGESGAEATGAATVLPGGDREASEQVVLPRLGERASVAGIVKDPRGQAVAGAQVCAVARSNVLVSSEKRLPICVTSERDGHYRIAGLFGVRQVVTASAPKFVPTSYSHGEGAAWRESIDLRPGMEAIGIDIVLEDGGVELHGVVKDLSGGPVEGALVAIDRAYATTGADGGFSMWARPGSRTVQAQADGYAPGDDDGVVPGHLFEVFLTPEAVIVGKVVRAGDRTPLEGVQVSVVSADLGSLDNTARTDAGGDFRIDALEPGAYQVHVRSDESLGQSAEMIVLGLGETSAPIVIEAHPAFVVEGRIVGDDGSSCDSGTMSLSQNGQNRGGWWHSEADGTARAQGILPGDYTVEVQCDGFVAEERYEPVSLTDRSISGLKWVVSRGRSIRGVIVDAGGKSVRGMSITASAVPDPSQPRARTTSVWGVNADPQGRFEVRGLLPGNYEVSVDAWGSEQRATPLEALKVTLPKGQDVDGVRIELPATGDLRGTIVDAQGRGVKGVSVFLASTSGPGRHTEAADDGSFKIEHVAEGEYRALPRLGVVTMRAPGASDDDLAGQKVEIVKGKTATVKLVVEGASGKITGVVRDGSGAPVADAFIESMRESESATAPGSGAMIVGRFSRFWAKPNLTDVDGRFTLAALPPGKHTLRAYRRGGGEANVEHVAIGSDVVLTIETPGRMSGTVSLRGGKTPEWFSIKVSDPKTGFARFETFFRTDGTFSLPELPAGNYTLDVSAGAGTATVEATMVTGKDTTDVRVELMPKVTVRGTVVDLEGKPVAGLVVSVIVRGGISFNAGDGAKLNVTDETGRYEVSGAPSGAVQVQVEPQSWGDGDFGYTSVPMVLAGDKSTVELPPIRVVRKRRQASDSRGDLGFSLKSAEPGADELAFRFVVAVVRPGGPAAAAGLQVGDEIVSVDGQDITGANGYLYRDLMGVTEGTAVTLGLANGTSVQVKAGKRP